jgi:transketolase
VPARRRRPGRRRIAARIIDLYSVKPADQATLADAAATTGGRLVIAEDHHPQGGLGAPCSKPLPGPACRSGSGSARSAACPAPAARDKLMEAAGIPSGRIAAAARALVKD